MNINRCTHMMEKHWFLDGISKLPAHMYIETACCFYLNNLRIKLHIVLQILEPLLIQDNLSRPKKLIRIWSDHSLLLFFMRS